MLHPHVKLNIRAGWVSSLASSPSLLVSFALLVLVGVVNVVYEVKLYMRVGGAGSLASPPGLLAEMFLFTWSVRTLRSVTDCSASMRYVLRGWGWGR